MSTQSKKSTVGPRKITLKPTPSTFYEKNAEYMNSLQGLTYKQLLRISSAVTATTEGEKAASRLFYRSLTPPESKVVISIRNESNSRIKKRKLRLLSNRLQNKNKTETADINITELIAEIKHQGDI